LFLTTCLGLRKKITLEILFSRIVQGFYWAWLSGIGCWLWFCKLLFCGEDLDDYWFLYIIEYEIMKSFHFSFINLINSLNSSFKPMHLMTLITLILPHLGLPRKAHISSHLLQAWITGIYCYLHFYNIYMCRSSVPTNYQIYKSND